MTNSKVFYELSWKFFIGCRSCLVFTKHLILWLYQCFFATLVCFFRLRSILWLELFNILSCFQMINKYVKVYNLDFQFTRIDWDDMFSDDSGIMTQLSKSLLSAQIFYPWGLIELCVLRWLRHNDSAKQELAGYSDFLSMRIDWIIYSEMTQVQWLG